MSFEHLFPAVDEARPSPARDHYYRLIGVVSVALWLLTALPQVIGANTFDAKFFTWLTGYLAAALAVVASVWTPLRWTRWHDALHLIATFAALTAFMLRGSGLEAIILVGVTAQQALLHSSRACALWIALRSIALYAVVAIHWNPRAALAVSLPYVALQAFTLLLIIALRREMRLREQLGAAHRDLVGAQERLREQTRDRERVRLARELHDDLGHKIVALMLNLEAALQPAIGPEGWRERVSNAQSLARDAHADLQLLFTELRQEQAWDVESALQQIAERIPTPKVTLDLALQGLIDRRLSVALVRSVQEIVTNAVKHARATSLSIEARVDDSRVRLLAVDDGVGGAAIVSGRGLDGLRRRLEALGGSLSIASASPKGTQIAVTIPVGAEPAA